jgi:2,4-dienoyl-CoA reductase (NADPH2)
VIVGMEGAPEDAALMVLHHPTGVTAPRTADWVVLATPGRPADELYRELRASFVDTAVTVHRVGDCVAPRRAHAAVIDGDRVGALL